jgi:anhydro-N-acetylmuramic acid kinase
MSGTSVDGLDLAYCSFREEDGHWSFEIIEAETTPYPDAWKNRLLRIADENDATIATAHRELGVYFGAAAKQFIEKHSIEADFIASHGHTVFHKPEIKYTLQIGDGQSIADICGITVINDFRSSDVAMGGQGAPLVPIGDRHLFSDYDYCLNIGGIANISYEDDADRIAYDICPANMVLNFLSGKVKKAFDDKGMMATAGNPILPLIQELESLPYYKLSGPRSLGREWVWENILPLLNKYEDHSIPDLLSSFTEHIAIRIATEIKGGKDHSMLVTGGGALNDFLIERMKAHTNVSIEIPDQKIIDFKEALIFAFLGLLRLEGINNVLGSVTGSGQDHCSGVITYPDQATTL